jgi:hypothetical protein
VLSLVLMALVSLSQTHTLGQKLVGTAPDAKDMIEIDGAKEPHRIPEWSAWRNAFELLAGGTTKDHLPSSLTPLVSAADVDLIFHAIDASKKNDAAYDEHRVKMFHRLLEVRAACDRQEPTDQKRLACQREKGGQVAAPFPEYEIAYRQRILDLRDRLLQQLDKREAVQAALVAWVSDQKKGIRVVMLKTEEAHYQRPQ